MKLPIALFISLAVLCGDPGTCCMDDEDGDGYTVEAGDCDDYDATIYPGAPEICDQLDNDCDGYIDEGCDPSAQLCFETGGSWEPCVFPPDCGSVTGGAALREPAPPADVCPMGCACPEAAPYWEPGLGCIPLDACNAPISR